MRKYRGALWGMGLLSPLDVAPLAAYCQSFRIWREAIEALDHAPPRDKPALHQVARNAAADAVKFYMPLRHVALLAAVRRHQQAAWAGEQVC